jgi:ElaB/YqjD/DUF883 family membrane-anchored ribosome-binding protein
MKKKTETIPTPADVLEDIRTLAVDAEKLVTASISEHTADAVSALRARYEAAQEKLDALYEGTKERVVAGAKYTDTAIREHPYQALAIAAGVGLVAGILLGRSSK